MTLYNKQKNILYSLTKKLFEKNGYNIDKVTKYAKISNNDF